METPTPAALSGTVSPAPPTIATTLDAATDRIIHQKAAEFAAKDEFWAPVIHEVADFATNLDFWGMVEAKSVAAGGGDAEQLFQLRISQMSPEEKAGPAYQELIRKKEMLAKAGGETQRKYTDFFVKTLGMILDVAL